LHQANDILMLDSHGPGDAQIGALGVTHHWELDRKIVESVRIPVIIAGGLGPDNVIAAIRAVRPAGVDPARFGIMRRDTIQMMAGSGRHSPRV
jgi:phosphoribosylanthranilate isomerase